MQHVFNLDPALFEFRRATVGWKTNPARGSVVLTPALIEGLVTAFLCERFDQPLPTQPVHRALWDTVCLPDRQVVIAAPRGISKSTSITHAFGLAAALFKVRTYIVLVSDTEGQAAAFLGDLKSELVDNDSLRHAFHVKRLVKDRETEFVCELEDGWQFKFVAKGSEQKCRGLKWMGRRPNLILVDDAEGDEQVESKERREKLMRWFLNALLPAGSDDCQVRVVGTVLHAAGALANFLEDPSWTSLRLSAHSRGYKSLLWPAKYPKERLEAIREGYVSQGKPDGYAREYLSRAVAEETAKFRKEDFIHCDRVPRTTRYMAVDFAVTTKTQSDWTVVPVVGLDEAGLMHIEHVERVRLDAKECVDMLIEMQKKWRPDTTFIAQGLIDHTIGPFLEAEMRRTGVYLNIWPVREATDILARSSSLQARFRSGSVRVNTAAPWYPDLYDELSQFPRAKHDDTVAALSLICLALADLHPAPTDVELAEQEYAEMRHEAEQDHGRCAITGY